MPKEVSVPLRGEVISNHKSIPEAHIPTEFPSPYGVRSFQTSSGLDEPRSLGLVSVPLRGEVISNILRAGVVRRHHPSRVSVPLRGEVISNFAHESLKFAP